MYRQRETGIARLMDLFGILKRNYSLSFSSTHTSPALFKFLLFSLSICALSFLNSCKSEDAATTNENTARPIGISILHDNDLAVAEWLNSSIEPFKKEVAGLFPNTEINLQLFQESTANSIQQLANGKLKMDAVLLPHYGFSDIINEQLENLGSALSSCKELIGSPYVAILPLSQASRLQEVLSRPVLKPNNQTIDVSLTELSEILQKSLYGYAHPGRSARGQFSLLLSLAAASPQYFENKASWQNAVESVEKLQKHLEWYSPSDSQLIKRLATQNKNSNNKELSLGLIPLRQLELRSEFKNSLAVLMPSDGTIWETHSLCISSADWVSPIKKSILTKYQNHLSSVNSLNKATKLGFLKADASSELVPKALKLSSAKSELSRDTSKALQKPFALAIAIDSSASVQSESLSQIRDFVMRINSTSAESSKIDFLRFSSDVQVLGDRKSLNNSLDSVLSKLIPAGGSSIYDTIAKQYEILSQYDLANHRRVALIITDGNDKNSNRSLEDIVDIVKDSSRSKGFVSLQMVVISPSQADLAPLNKIVEAANGALYQTEAEGLPQLLAEIQGSL